MIYLFALIFSTFAFAQDFLDIDHSLKLAAEAAWNQSKFDNTQILAVNPSTHFPTHSSLNLVVLADSNWTTDLILEQVRGIERVYSQCEVSFSPITLIQTSAAKATRKWWSDNDDAADALIFDEHLMASQPTVIYRKSGGAYSWPRYYLDLLGTTATYPQLLNNAVVSYDDYIVNKHTDYVPADYVVSAHELAHIFLNSPHAGMCGDLIHGGPTCKGSHLSAEDCSKVREFLANSH